MAMLRLLRLNSGKTRARAQQVAGAVALQRLHFDDLGPQIGQHHAAGRAHDHVGEFDHAQACQWQARGLLSSTAPWKTLQQSASISALPGWQMLLRPAAGAVKTPECRVQRL